MMKFYSLRNVGKATFSVYLLFLLSLTLISSVGKAQTFQYNWANTYGNSYSQSYYYSCGSFSYPSTCMGYNYSQTSVNSSFYTNSGTVVLAGSFMAPINANPAGSSVNLGANYDFQNKAFLANYDNSGTLLWAKELGASSSTIKEIGTDSNGNVYAVGTYSGTVIINGTTSVSSNGGTDVFLAKYSSSGALLWIKSFGGTSTDDVSSAYIDSAGNFYLTGHYYSNFDADAGTGITTLNYASGTNSFVIKYSSEGEFKWAKSFFGSNYLYSQTISADKDQNVYIGANFRGTIDVDPEAGTVNLTSTSNNSFILKLNENGSYLWSKHISGSSTVQAHKIRVDEKGNLITSGSYNTAVDLDPQNIGGELSSANGAWICKYASNGTLTWYKGYQPFTAGYIRCDEDNRIYITGYLSISPFDADPGTADVNLASITGSANNDIFLGVYDEDGTYVTAKRLGDGDFEQGLTLAVFKKSRLFLGGSKNGAGSMDFDPGIATVNKGFYSSSSNGFAAEYLIAPAPTITSFSPSTGGEGVKVVITGSGFSTASSVTFGGKEATSFTVIDDTKVEAIIPAEASSGNVAVTTAVSTASVAGFTYSVSPSITFASASTVGSTSAKLEASILLNNNSVTVSFLYGKKEDLSDAQTATDGGALTEAQPGSQNSSASLSGLDASTKYYYQVKVVSAAGTKLGDVNSFTTLSNVATLSALTISEGTLSPAFDAGTLEYSVLLDNSKSSIKLTPTLSQSNATLTIIGSTATSGSESSGINLNLGSNEIPIIITAQDGNTTKTYTVTVKRQSSQTITFDALASKTYGDADFDLGATASSNLDITYTSSDPTVASVSGKTVTIKKAGITKITAKQTGSEAYSAATEVEQTLTVKSKTLTITAKDKDKTYGEAVTFAGTEFEKSELVGSDAVTSVTLSSTGTTASANANATGYDIEVSGAQGTGLSNYEITYVKGKLKVAKKALTVTAENKNKTYGDANPALTVTYSGLVNGETALSPTPTVSTTVTQSSAVGNYDISVTGTSDNYSLSFVKGTLTVGKKALTVMAENKNKTYGDANPALTVTYSGLVNSETALSPAPTVTTTATQASGVGTYDITATATSDNYELTFNKGTLTVGKKALTVTADNKSKTYGDANPALTVTYSGLVNGETALSPAPTVSTIATVTSGAGTYDITATGTSANYDLTFVKGALTVGKKALTVTAEDKNKTYGDANPALTVTYSGLVNGETALSPAPMVTTTATQASGVGTYDITATGTSDNYELTFNKGTLTVGKKALTVTAENKSKTYGDANPALTVTYAGLVNSETALSPAPIVTTTATQASGVGSYDITATGTAANYDLTFVKGTLIVGRKVLTVTAENKAKTYGDANPALTVTYSGLVNGETALSPAPTVTTAVTNATGVGSYDINVSGAASNYDVTYVKGTLTVGKKALTITAENKEKFQGLALPAFTTAYSGFVNGESSSVLTTQPSFATTATANSAQGTYPINVSAATAANYAITFVPGVLTVKPGYPTSITLAATSLYENAPVSTVAGTLSSTSDDPSATFTYTLVNGTGSTDNASFKISGNQIQTNAVLNFESKASYSILVRSTTQHGLSLDKAFTIILNNVNEQPTLNNIAAQTICYTPAQQTVALSGISAGEDANQTTNVTVSSTNNNLFKSLTVTQATNGTAQVRYTVADGASGSAVVNIMVIDNGGTANGGINTILKSFVLNVNALPVPTITTNKGVTSISKGDVLVLKAAGGTQYQWSNAPGILSGDNTANLTIRPDATTTYRVLVTNASGCSETKEITIEVTEDYVMLNGSNLISPNGDGINDVFKIDNIDMYPNNTVKIFDRAGRLLYSKKGYSKDGDWNGTLNGAPLAEDTYYYVVDFGTNKPKIQGYITIVRD